MPKQQKERLASISTHALTHRRHDEPDQQLGVGAARVGRADAACAATPAVPTAAAAAA